MEVEEESWEEGGKKRVRLSTDQEKAHLIRLCINNFGRFGEGKDKFFQSITQLFEKEINAKPPNVRTWMNRREHERMKEVEEGEFYCTAVSVTQAPLNFTRIPLSAVRASMLYGELFSGLTKDSEGIEWASSGRKRVGPGNG